VVVTSPLVASECSHVAAGLAAALTRRGMASAVLQVHGDEVSAPELPAVPAVRVLDADDVLTAEDASLPAALDRLRAGRPMLVVDVPGAVITTDAQVMGAEADAVLVVVTAGTRTARVRQTIAGLDSVGAPILGTVLVQRAEPAAAPTGTPRSSAASAPPEDGLDTLGWPADEPNGRSAAATAGSTNSKRSRRTAVSSRGNR
jgi:Mrp family chromosome partitioning ATPase